MKYLFISFSLSLLFVSCKKETIEDPSTNAGATKITFHNSGNDSALPDTIPYTVGDQVKFKVKLSGEAGLSSIKYDFIVVGIIENTVAETSLGGLKSHEFHIDNPVADSYAGKTIIFRFTLVDNEGTTVIKDMVCPISAVTGDYIGYFLPQDVDTVYNNSAYSYELNFFSIGNNVFQSMDVNQSVNGGSQTTIETLVPNQVQNGAGANYRYYGGYTPNFPASSTNIVQTEFLVYGPSSTFMEKTHTLVIINN